jgi:pimeloyl-ACP methyl ester carboxylesterase
LTEVSGNPPLEWDLTVGPRDLQLCISDWAGPEPTVVLLHGFLEQSMAWDRVARRLGRRVVAPDHRGHGRSGHVGDGGWYHFWDYVGDLDQLVEHLGGPIDLVGHSMGGTIACLYAGARPEMVRRLVLVEGLGPPDAASEAVDRARRYLADRRSPPQHKPMRDLTDAASRLQRFSPAMSEEEARWLAERVTSPEGDNGLVWSWDPLHRAAMPGPFQASLFLRFLHQIQAPVLLVDGGRSPWILPDLAERVAALREVRRTVIDSAGHLIHHDAPEALAAANREHQQ